jgi:hypothetical protein
VGRRRTGGLKLAGHHEKDQARALLIAAQRLVSERQVLEPGLKGLQLNRQPIGAYGGIEVGVLKPPADQSQRQSRERPDDRGPDQGAINPSHSLHGYPPLHSTPAT